ncbi:MAG TPA: hypothetical protein VL860_12700 [Planctomycetota bacterium]|nr:hypothetical protein [Planctomycetota bacterium]
MPGPRALDTAFLQFIRARIEAAVVPVMEKIYRYPGVTFGADFRPELKPLEQIVVYYDYQACGISVLAAILKKAPPDDPLRMRAQALFDRILAQADHYRRQIFNSEVAGAGRWTVPLRRLLFHVALAYRTLGTALREDQRNRLRELVEQQIPVVLEHNHQFHPGVKDIHLGVANNHGAIFMQGVYYCGKVFDHPEWSEQAREFAERFYASGHDDGYWEEHTNAEREGGPSMIYTPLTAGCLFDVLEGHVQPREKFVRAGRLFRTFLNDSYEMMPIADERTNTHSRWSCYGLALHALTPEGRTYVRDVLEEMDFAEETPESLAVIHHELELMQTGSGATPENHIDGPRRITLPLGVLRRAPWTAGISALRALNRTRAPNNDYALDHQQMVYLAHAERGVLLSGFKSKRDPGFSTFQIGADAYPVRTGWLTMTADRAEARLNYETFVANLRWELPGGAGGPARLMLAEISGRPVTTTLPITPAGLAALRTTAPFTPVDLPGFSPYTTRNAAETVPAIRFEWRNSLVLEFH